MEKVFIYGTLKRGFAFHEKGLAGAMFLGLYQTVKPYPLYIAKLFYGPMMLERPGEGLAVQGEVHEADKKRLLLIDGLEDIGKPGSFRSKILVETAGGGNVWKLSPTSRMRVGEASALRRPFRLPRPTLYPPVGQVDYSHRSERLNRDYNASATNCSSS
jgi:gamma-glutamylaminecyclotransferase